MEFAGLNPLGSMAAFAVEAPLRKAFPVTRIAASDHARGAGTDSRQRPDQESTAAEARDIAALRRKIERRALPAGPPPAFEMNLLEAEGGLDQALARIEAARSRDRDAPALRPAAPKAEPRAAATSEAAPAATESPAPRATVAQATPSHD